MYSKPRLGEIDMPLPQALQKPAEFVRSLGTARIDDKAEAKTTVTLDDVDVVAPDSDDTRPLIIVTYASVGSGHRLPWCRDGESRRIRGLWQRRFLLQRRDFLEILLRFRRGSPP